jgi:hypothetical protein
MLSQENKEENLSEADSQLDLGMTNPEDDNEMFPESFEEEEE